MKKTLTLSFIAVLLLTVFSCGSQVKTISEKNILHISGKFEDVGSLEDVYNYADYVVICEVTGVGKSYLRSGKELDTTLPMNEIMETLVGVRTPYEITVMKNFKGNLEAGDVYTVLSLEGILDGYAVDAGLPDLEVGKTYFMPICISDPQESLPYFPALAEINESRSMLSDRQSTVEPMMFDSPYDGIDDVSELTNHLEAIKSVHS